MPKPKDIAADIVTAAARYSTDSQHAADPITIHAHELLSIVKDHLNRLLSDVATERR